ncbi:hypothetical protein DSCW_45390 [Desulfosarcina widdelii]|uniref:Uncharacterized protein n=1 Tax=Desulfosarcina widdelii TaxID=947919 RepID=A0A5K7Z532_9BACT|nr:hypothetical protein DSCW_45390 [Desulfosarcina widdelii]
MVHAQALGHESKAPDGAAEQEKQIGLDVFFYGHEKAVTYWLPNPFCPPQSGHCQVIPLQDMPHTFSFMQSWQIMKPQRQDQQKGTLFPQQWQVRGALRRRRLRRLVRVSVSFMTDC